MFGSYYTGQFFGGQSGGFSVVSSLYVEDSLISLVSDNVVITQQHGIVANNTNHSLTSDAVELVEHLLIAIQNANHSLEPGEITLTQAHSLLVADTLLALSNTQPALSVVYYLDADDTAHILVSDNVDVTTFTLLNTPDDVLHALTSDSFWIPQDNKLDPEEAMHILKDNLGHIINWNALGKDFGNYGEDGVKSGIIGIDTVNSGQIGENQINSDGTFEPVTIQKGYYSETRYDIVNRDID